MVLARVKGQAVAAARVPDLEGRRLLLVELLTVGGEEVVPTRRHMVCVDAVGAPEFHLDSHPRAISSTLDDCVHLQAALVAVVMNRASARVRVDGQVACHQVLEQQPEVVEVGFQLARGGLQRGNG